MLEREQHQNTSSPQAPHAASARVTAEEFTAAVDALEQRKAQEATRLAGTVNVGQTISELGIDASPDEVLREIEAQRAKRLQAQDPAAQRARSIEDAQTQFAAAAAAAATIARTHLDLAAQRVQARATARIERRSGPRRLWRLGAIFGVLWAAGMISSLHHGPASWFGRGITIRSGGDVIHVPSPVPITIDDGSGRTGQALALSNIADGQTVYCDTQALSSLVALGGKVSPHDAAVSGQTGSFANSWAVVRHGKTLYVKGYIQPEVQARLGTGPVVIYDDDDSGALRGSDANAVVLPLDGAAVGDVSVHDDWSSMTLDHVKVDSQTSDRAES